MAFTTMAQVLAAMPGQAHRYSKQGIVVSAGAWSSEWNGTGWPPAAANPSSGVAGDIPTNLTIGAFPFVNPASGDLNLARLTEATNFTGGLTVVLYDRLWHNSGISATAITAQTINSVALDRPDALGADVEAWWQVYVGMGSGTPQITLTYTDQDGNTGNSALSGTLATAMSAGRTGIFSLAAGDTGVRSIQTYQADASFTSGTIGLVLRRRIAAVSHLNVEQGISDILRCGIERVYNSACLELLVCTASSGNISVYGDLWIVNG